VATNEPLWAPTARGPQRVAAATIAAALTPATWARLSVGEGSKGPRVYDRARARLARRPTPGRAHRLLVRRSLADPTDLAYYVVFAPAGTRWAVEEGFAIAKGAVGLDHYAVRRWEAGICIARWRSWRKPS